jgi:hypothetical protein
LRRGRHDQTTGPMIDGDERFFDELTYLLVILNAVFEFTERM